MINLPSDLSKEPFCDWKRFLVQHGAQFNDAPNPQLIGFTQTDNFSSIQTDYVTPLTDFGLIVITGADATHFLHNQLTNDIEKLGDDEARLAGYCSPKGRLLASMLCWRTNDAILLMLPRSILAAIQKRLQMFVLRAKAKLRDASDEYVILGLAGSSAETLITSQVKWRANHAQNLYAKTESNQDFGTSIFINVPDSNGIKRFLWITNSTVAMHAWPLLAQNLRLVSPAAWRLAEIYAGIPWITLETQEQFVPQMINFELIGGVNFKKGCYPGQEIVARTHYLGKIKRRMLLATANTHTAKAGMEVFASTDPSQPCGMIVNAEKSIEKNNVNSDNNPMTCLVEIKVAATEGGTVHLGSAQGPALQFFPLPYLLPDAVS